MKHEWHDKNLGKSPQDPDYLEGYNSEEDLERYEEEQELRRMLKKERKDYV